MTGLSQITELIPAVGRINDDALREALCRTWAEAFRRGPFESFVDVPQGLAVPTRSLLTHVNDVNRLALSFIDVVHRDYGLQVDAEVALAGAILHDVDKAFILTRLDTGAVAYVDGWESDDHGRLGAELAMECGVPEEIADLVRFHNPFSYEGHLPGTVEGTIVHYADLAAADFGAIQHGAEPIHARTLIVKKEQRFLEMLAPKHRTPR